MSLLSPQHSAALTDPQTWTDNPFFHRDARRDHKRRQLTKTLAWLAALLLMLGGFAVWGLTALVSNKVAISWFLGGDIFTSLLIVVSGVHIWFIANVSQKHTAQMLTQEAFRNTLSHLLMLPTSGFRILLQAAIYPWWAGMRLAFLMLPVYLVFVGLGILTWAELVMLYLVFATAAFTLPVWRFPALADNVAVTAATPSQRPANAAGAALSGQGNTRQTTAATGLNGGMTLTFFLPFFLFLFTTANRRGFGGMYETLHPYLPDNLLTLMPTSMLSWPLLLARGAIAPLDWYGTPIPPLPFFLAFLVVSRYLHIVRVSEFLQVGSYRDLALLPTYVPRRKWEGALRIAQMFVLGGYLWKWAIWNGGLDLMNASGLANAPRGAAPGLESFAYLLLFALALRLFTRCSQIGSWLRPLKPDPQRNLVRVLTVRSALRYLLEPLAFTFGFYLVCCLVSRTAPFPPAVLSLGGKMLAILGVGGLLSLGIERFSVFGLSALLRIGAFLGPILGVVYYAMPQMQRLAYYSPSLGLLSLGNPGLLGLTGLYQPPLYWQNWVLYEGILGAVLAVLTLVLALRRKPDHQETQAVRVDPTRMGFEVYTEENQAQKKKTTESMNPVGQRLVAALQRCWENAVAIREIRGRMRGRQDLDILGVLLIGCLVVTLVLFQGMPAIPTVFGDALAKALFGQVQQKNAALFADILACWYIVQILVSLFSSFATSRSFAPERDKSTLGFLLMTPMSGSAIVMGKLVGILLCTMTLLAPLLVWTLVMSLALASMIGPVVLGVWGALAITSIVIYITFGMIALAAAAISTRWSLNKNAWVVVFIVFQALLMNGGWVWTTVSDFLNALGWSAPMLWCAFLVICIVLASLSFLLSLWALAGMRRKDLAFAASKREN